MISPLPVLKPIRAGDRQSLRWGCGCFSALLASAVSSCTQQSLCLSVTVAVLLLCAPCVCCCGCLWCIATDGPGSSPPPSVLPSLPRSFCAGTNIYLCSQVNINVLPFLWLSSLVLWLGVAAILGGHCCFVCRGLAARCRCCVLRVCWRATSTSLIIVSLKVTAGFIGGLSPCVD